MLQNISNHRARAGRMKNFFADNNSVIAPNTDILNEISVFNDLLEQFDEFAGRQRQPITSYAKAKVEAHEEAAVITGKWGVRCHLKAAQSGMPLLAELLNNNRAEIIRLDDEASLTLMKDMRTGLNDNLALFAGQGVTAAIITAIDNKIAAYEALMNKPKEAISERKADTEALAVLMKLIKEPLENIVTLLAALWTPDHLELIAAMKNNMRIDDLGHRYSGIEGTVANPLPQGVANFKVVCEKEKTKPDEPDYIKEAESNLVGKYKIKSLKPGLYTVKLVNPEGSVVQTTILTIKRGVTVDWDWRV